MTNAITRTVVRIWGFIRGNQDLAEGTKDRPEFPPLDWIVESAQTADLASHVVDATKRAADFANDVVAKLQEKASSLVTLSLALVPFAAAGTGLALTAKKGSTLVRSASIGLFCVVDLSLILSALFAFFASGLIHAGALNPEKLTDGSNPAVPQLQATEADSWYSSSRIAIWNASRVAHDLFTARRWVVSAVVFAVFGIPLLIVSRH